MKLSPQYGRNILVRSIPLEKGAPFHFFSEVVLKAGFTTVIADSPSEPACIAPGLLTDQRNYIFLLILMTSHYVETMSFTLYLKKRTFLKNPKA